MTSETAHALYNKHQLYKQYTSTNPLCAPSTSSPSQPQHYSNMMTPDPTCPDCKRPFKTRKGLSIHSNQCPKRQLQTKQKKQWPDLSSPFSETEEGTSNWRSEENKPWVEHKFYSKPNTPTKTKALGEHAPDVSRPQISKIEAQIAFRSREA